MIDIGIMGGTFDPLTIGHVNLADSAQEEHALAEVLFIPDGQPRDKKDVTEAALRFRMTEDGIAGNPKFKALRIAIDRGGVTYAVDTLEELRKMYGDDVRFNWLMGRDVLELTKTWHQHERVYELCRILVGPRVGHPLESREDLEKILTGPTVLPITSSHPINVSSSAVRKLRGAGRRARYLVPAGTYAVMEENGLYLPQAKSEGSAA